MRSWGRPPDALPALRPAQPNLKASMSRSTFCASPCTRMCAWNFLSASSNSMAEKSISSTTQLKQGKATSVSSATACVGLSSRRGTRWQRQEHGGLAVREPGCLQGVGQGCPVWAGLCSASSNQQSATIQVVAKGPCGLGSPQSLRVQENVGVCVCAIF